MKMNLRYSLLFSVLVALMLNSCQRPSKKFFQFIPETAKAVVTVHPGKLIEKGKLTELTFLKEGVSGSEIAEKILEDPESSGIDMDNYSSFFVFGDEPAYAGIVMPISNKVDFENMITELEIQVDEKFERGKLDKYDLIKQEAGIVLYDNSIAMALSSMGKWGQDIEEVAERLINLEDEEKILSNKDFNKFLARQKDINAWFTSTNLKGMNQLGDAIDLLGGIRNNYGHVFLEFQKGAMVLNTNLRLNQSMQETVDKFNFLDQDAIKALLDYIPSDDLVFVGNTNVNPEKIIDLLQFVNKDFNEAFEGMTDAFDIEEEDIRKAFSGEMAFSINGVHRFRFEEESDGEIYDFKENMPVLVAATRMKNESLFGQFLEVAEQENALKKKDEYYVVQNRGLPAYMVLYNQDLIVSNREDIIIEISEKGKIDENVTLAEYSDILIQDPICFYLNLDAGTYSEDMQDFIDEEMGERVEMGLETFGSKLKSLSFSANLEEWELRLELTEEDEYSLYTLLSQIDK